MFLTSDPSDYNDMTETEDFQLVFNFIIFLPFYLFLSFSDDIAVRTLSQIVE